MTSDSQTLRELFVSGITNLHAVEKQALAIMTPQIARIENYPEVAERLRLHVDETNAQIARLDEILAAFDTGSSSIKDMGLSLSGSMAAVAHTVAGDEILKNSFANYAFEHFEIAAYKSVIILANDGGFGGSIPFLQESLREEQSMAQWIEEALPNITRRYASLYADGGSATAKV